MTSGKAFYLSVVYLGSLLLAGCVMNEKYEAEKARALNFQRLLAQEEKRTGELDAELKRLKRETPELDARNRELAAQLEAVREQMARVQEETAALRESAALKAREELHRSLQPKGKSAPASKSAPKSEKSDKLDMAVKGEFGVPLMHDVKPGETLFGLSRQYGVEVKSLKEWNHLRDSTIDVGQRLIVGYQ